LPPHDHNHESTRTPRYEASDYASPESLFTMQSEIEATIKHCDPVVAEYAAGYLNHAAHQFSAENDPLADAAAAITSCSYLPLAI
jgi:hypothetical protein